MTIVDRLNKLIDIIASHECNIDPRQYTQVQMIRDEVVDWQADYNKLRAINEQQYTTLAEYKDILDARADELAVLKLALEMFERDGGNPGVAQLFIDEAKAELEKS